MVPVPVEAKKAADGTIDFRLRRENRAVLVGNARRASLINFSAGNYIKTKWGLLTTRSTLSSSRPTAGTYLEYRYGPGSREQGVSTPTIPTKTEHLFGSDVEISSHGSCVRPSPRPGTPLSSRVQDVIQRGEKLFRDNIALGCAICHQPEFTTPKAGTAILTLDKKRGSDMAAVPAALGDKVIHPFSDFLLHDVGTGDGIAQTQHADLPSRGQRNLQKIPDAYPGPVKASGRVDASTGDNNRRVLAPTDPGVDQRTANKVRTAPLWGLRARPQLMHDGLSLTIEDAIHRHKGQSEGVRLKYGALTPDQKRQLLAFLSSL